MPQNLSFYQPTQVLRELVTSYYIVSSEVPLQDYLHPEWANIRFGLKGEWRTRKKDTVHPTPRRSSLYGPTNRTKMFETDGGVLMGIGLTPIGWERLIGRDASRLANDVEELGDTLAVAGDALAADLAADADDNARVQRLNRVLEAVLSRAAPADPLISPIQQGVSSGNFTSVSELAAYLAISERRLHRICRRVFGFGPKTLMKRQRFLKTLENFHNHLSQPVMQQLDNSYYDQPQFSREFRTFMGMTPTEYFNSPRELMRRAALERQRVIGRPMQGLHDL